MARQFFTGEDYIPNGAGFTTFIPDADITGDWTMRKFSLLFAAALMACVLQTAYAGEDQGDNDDSAAVTNQRGFRNGMRGFGPGMGRGGPGHGPAMYCSPGSPQMMHGRGPGMMRHDSGFGGGMEFGMIGPRMLEELEITADQRSKIIDVATESFRERLELRWEMAEAKKKLNDLKDAEGNDYDAIVAASEALGSVQGKLDVARRKVKDQFAAILTPEQHEKIEKFKEDRQNGRDERRANRDRDDRPGKRSPGMMRGPGPRR